MLFHGDVRTALQAAVTVCYLNPIPSCSTGRRAGVRERRSSYCPPRASSPPFSSRSLSIAVGEVAGEDKKPATCTADELHHVAVPGTEWRLALWRYTPPPEAPSRNHPLVLLSGVGTNAIGFDLSPGASFARHMSSQGFDTWIVEMRGAGLSKRALESNAIEQYSNSSMESDLIESVDKDKEGVRAMKLQSADKTSSQLDLNIPAVNGNKEKSMTSFDELQLVMNLTDTFMRLAERLSGYLNEGQSRVMSAKLLDRISKLLEDTRLAERYNEIRGKISGLLEARQNSAVSSQIRDLSQRLVNIIEEGQRSVSPQLNDLQERLSATIDDFQKQLDLIVTYDWDFDHYLEEDIPAVMEYIKFQSKPKDGRLFAIGHSMGGILLYAMLSRYAFEGKETGMAAVVTLASSLDYTSSKSSLKLLLPLADPAQALSVPVVPLGALLAAAYPLLMRPPYVLSWLSSQISAQDMMHPELFEKLVLNNFCTVPFKLLLQLTTAFREGGLRNRTGTFFYKDHLHKCNVPVLALAGDQDLICPPEAVHETVKLLPKGMATYKVFGDPNGRHYAHYDLVGGRLAIDEVYPCIIEFLGRYDATMN